MIPIFQKLLPQVGTQIVGIWRPATTASDVTAELTAAKDAGAQIIMPIMTGPVGIPLVTQWADLQIPAVVGGLDNQPMAPKYWQVTGGRAQYVLCSNNCPRANITPMTIPFYDKYFKKYNDFPIGWGPGAYNSIYVLKEAVERAGTLDPDRVVVELEKTDLPGAGGRVTFMGRDTQTPHDLVFGPKHNFQKISQWIDKQTYLIWPNGRPSKLGEGWEKVNFGARDITLPPWMVEYWKKRS
jgi:branched-chain amino acid transport system substrate-binding protein